MLSPGTLLQNRYQIIRQIGGGGMGIVYLADDIRLAGHQCAIKEMSPANVPPQDWNWAISLFRQEAQLLANLKHPGLVQVTDYFTELGNWYLVMDYVPGQTLETWLEQTPGGYLPLHIALNYVEQLCTVLDYLHNQQPPVVFRDLKPDNVMVTPSGNLKLIDFGIARFFKPGQTHNTINLGTPGYASPEHRGRGQTDPRSDIYGLGVMLHEMVTGNDPTGTPFALPPARKLNSTVPPEIEAAIQRATQLRPDQRFQTISEFRQALFPLQPVAPSARPSSRRYFMAIGLAAALGIIGLILLTVRPPTEPPVAPTDLPTAITAPRGVTKPASAPASPTPAAPTEAPTPTPVPMDDHVLIPSGNFVFGATSADIQLGERLCDAYGYAWCKGKQLDDEKVNAGSQYVAAFRIDRTEVTNTQYAACVRAGACQPPKTNGLNPRRLDFDGNRCPACPVVYVTWNDAQQYCQWAGGQLPTSLQWEKAARGEDGRPWPWGSEIPTASYANFRVAGEPTASEENDGSRRLGSDAAPAGSYPSDTSPYGIQDTAGNVMEWVEDWAPLQSVKREIRGGSWNAGSYATRLTHRAPGDPAEGYFDVGFRCAYPAS